MNTFFQNLLTASAHGSIVILAVILLRAVLKKAPRKFICYLWMLAGIRLLTPVSVRSKFSLQPVSLPLPSVSSRVVLILWVSVAAIIGATSIIAYLNLQRRVRDAVKVPGGYESEKIETAFVLGFVKPKIYIPTGMSRETCNQILAHERTHLEKGDHWIKMIAFVALVLHWFNPLVWVAYLMLCKDIEIACDERVVQFMELEERKAYSSALLQCSTNKLFYAASPAAFGEISVKYRIKSVLRYRKPGFVMSLLGLISIAFVALCLLTSPVNATTDEQAALRKSSHQSPAAFVVAQSPESPENPDWGVTLFMDVKSPTGGYLASLIEERFIQESESITLKDAILEQWSGEAWVPYPVQGSLFPGFSVHFASSRDYTISDDGCDIDWSLTAGSLSQGDYRIALTVSGEDTGKYCATFYAPFHIYREQLPAEEEAALERCTAAIKALSNKQSYSIRLSELSPAGSIQPVMQLDKGGNSIGRLTYYYGEFTVSSAETDPNNLEFSSWQADYDLNQNRKILFPDGDSCISQEEITFRSVWSDYTGTVYNGKDTFHFTDNGDLEYAQREVETLDADGNITNREIDRLDVLSDSVWINSTVYEPEDSYIAQQRSPWGIFFRVDDDYLKPYGGEVWIATNAVGISDYTTDCNYWLEKWDTDHWTRLGDENTEGSWGTDAIPVMSKTTIINVDWSETYGNLPAGVYRMGKRFYSGSESNIQYAEFSIPKTGGIFGVGSEEALARVDAAIEKLRQSSFRMEHSYYLGEYLDDQAQSSEVIWGYHGAEVYDFNVSTGYRHSIYTDGDDNVMYGTWCEYEYGNGEYNCYYFSDEYGAISDREITFAVSFSQSATTNPLIIYTYRFDEDGNLTEILTHGRGNGFYTSRYTVTDTPESEVKAWVEKVKAQS